MTEGPRRHLLTGAGSGIGEALARRLVERGDTVTAVARSATRAAEMAAAVPGIDPVVADLDDPGALEALEAVLPGTVDSLVHAGGVIDLGTVAELSAEQWREQLGVNVLAPAVLTRVCLPALRAAHGRVVFVNSSAGRVAKPQWAAYAASKHGLKALAEALAAEEPDLRVTTIFPGRVATPMQQRVHEHEGRSYDPEALIDPVTIADLVLTALDLPADAVVPEIVVRPR